MKGDNRQIRAHRVTGSTEHLMHTYPSELEHLTHSTEKGYRPQRELQIVEAVLPDGLLHCRIVVRTTQFSLPGGELFTVPVTKEESFLVPRLFNPLVPGMTVYVIEHDSGVVTIESAEYRTVKIEDFSSENCETTPQEEAYAQTLDAEAFNNRHPRTTRYVTSIEPQARISYLDRVTIRATTYALEQVNMVQRVYATASIETALVSRHAFFQRGYVRLKYRGAGRKSKLYLVS